VGVRSLGGGSEGSDGIGSELTRTIVSFLEVERGAHEDCIAASRMKRLWMGFRLSCKRPKGRKGDARKGSEP